MHIVEPKGAYVGRLAGLNVKIHEVSLEDFDKTDMVMRMKFFFLNFGILKESCYLWPQ